MRQEEFAKSAEVLSSLPSLTTIASISDATLWFSKCLRHSRRISGLLCVGMMTESFVMRSESYPTYLTYRTYLTYHTVVLTLFLDFASHHKIIALAEGAKTLALEHIKDHTDEARLLPMIESMLENNKHALSDLGRIASVAGPGGFMSQRVGLSIANALAWSLKIPIAGVHLSDLWFARLSSPLPSGEGLGVRGIVWLHSTKKDSLFIRGFNDLAKQWPEPALISFSDLVAPSSPLQASSFVGELIPEHRSALAMKDADTRPLEEILPALLDTLSYGQPPVLPWYGRGI